MNLLITVSSLEYRTISSYCLKCKKQAENINPRVSKTSNAKAMFSSKCVICGTKISRLIKEQEPKGILVV